MEPVVSAGALSPWEPGIFALTLYGMLILAFVTAQLFIASWLGEKKPSIEKSRPYECGVIPTGSARLRYPVPFYLVAIFFLIFDVEGSYILTWAVSYEKLGWYGWMQMAFFIAVLLVALLYLWKKGGLDWMPVSRRR
jgi:NADH-quinone oxidoreductase subunit A